MLAKRLIPCLDVKDGRVVKGVNFVELRDAGDPVECAKRYSDEGADEITFLDISASAEGRSTTLRMVEATAKAVRVPLTVGGGVREVEDVRQLLLSGADKVAINSAAVSTPELIDAASGRFGSQAIVVAIDAKHSSSGWRVYTHGGRTESDKEAVSWAREVVRRGAGELLLTSMDRDGTGDGYDIALTRAVVEAVPVPVIASGGVGSLQHLVAGFKETGAEAALAATIFHDGHHSLGEAKAFLRDAGVHVRL